VGANYGIYRDLVLDQIAKDKPARVLGCTNQPHSFSYVPDAARAMAAIGISDDGWGRAWITPVMAPITQADLVARLWDALGQRGKPTVVDCGRVVALWSRKLMARTVRVEVTALAPLDDGARARIGDAAEECAAYVERPLEVEWVE